MNKKIAVFTIVILIMIGIGWSQVYRISGDCMEPAIRDGHFYWVDRISPLLRQYQMGDIVTFKHEEKMWISRVVALEGDTISLAEGKVIINGRDLQDNVLRNWSGWNYGTFAIDKPFTVPKDSIFVLSDNLSAQHDDSRVFGSISKSELSGWVW